MVIRKRIKFVPWADRQEWETVRNQILSKNLKDLNRGYETLLMWKLKDSALPAYIESTIGLLQVKIKLHKTRSPFSILEENDLRLSCSTALIRFVNHVSSLTGGRGATLYSSAKAQKIPDWIINIRHEAAHSQDLPSLDALLAALDFSFEWLLINYWNREDKNEIKEQDKSKTSRHLKPESSYIHKLFQLAFAVWDFKEDNKTQVVNTKPEFLTLLQELLNFKQEHFSHLEFSKEEKLQSALTSSNESGMKVGELRSTLLVFFQALAKAEGNKEPFLISLLNSSFLKDAAMNFKKWQKMLEIIQNAKLLGDLIGRLFERAANGNEKASRWLLALHPSLKLLRKTWTMYRTLRKETKGNNSKRIKKQIQEAELAKIKRMAVKLNFSRPPTVSLSAMEKALLNPDTPHLGRLLRYLKLIKPRLLDATVSLIEYLVGIGKSRAYSHTNGETHGQSEKIFTLEDLPEIPEVNVSNVRSSREWDSDAVDWTKSRIDVHAWSECPIGLLPFQRRVECDLPDDLEWTVEFVEPCNGIPTIVQKPLSSLIGNWNFDEYSPQIASDST